MTSETAMVFMGASLFLDGFRHSRPPQQRDHPLNLTDTAPAIAERDAAGALSGIVRRKASVVTAVSDSIGVDRLHARPRQDSYALPRRRATGRRAHANAAKARQSPHFARP